MFGDGAVAEEKKNNWLFKTFLILAGVAFLGISTVPFVLESMKNGSQTSVVSSASPTASASATPAGPKKEELEAQVKGYELVLQREPDNQTALRGLVETRGQLQDFKGMVAPLEKLAKLNPNDSSYGVLLAQVKQQTGDLDGAAETYRSILQTRKGDLNALNGLTNLLLQQQRPEAAIALLQDTLKSAPQANEVQPGSIDMVSVELLLGSVYSEQKRYDEAVALYESAIKRDAKDFRPMLAKAIVLKAQGKVEEAKPLFASASNLAPAQFKDQINQLANAPLPGASVAPSAAPTTAPETPSSPVSSESPSNSDSEK